MKILFFTKNWIGDVIFAEPLIRAIKKTSPDNYVICACPARCRSFLEHNPHVDEVITFDEKDSHRSPIARLRFIGRLARMDIDRVYLLHRSFSRALLCVLAGIKERVGYDTKGRSWLLTTSYHCNGESRAQQHDVDYFLRLAGDIEIAQAEREYRFYYSDADSNYAQDLLNEIGIHNNEFIVINPGANWIPKRWPLEYFARFADLFHERFSLPLVITGNQDNQSLAKSIIERTMNARCFSVCGKTTLTQAGALFARSMLVVTADSGPMHIASGVGAYVLALFGPTDDVRTGPRGVGENEVLSHRNSECIIPCYEEKCSTFECMGSITPEMVMQKVEQILSDRL